MSPVTSERQFSRRLLISGFEMAPTRALRSGGGLRLGFRNHVLCKPYKTALKVQLTRRVVRASLERRLAGRRDGPRNVPHFSRPAAARHHGRRPRRRAGRRRTRPGRAWAARRRCGGRGGGDGRRRRRRGACLELLCCALVLNKWAKTVLLICQKRQC